MQLWHVLLHDHISTLIGEFPGYELDRFMENSSNQKLKYGRVFQKSVQLMPQKFRKNTGYVSQKLVCVTSRKTEISGNFLDEFSRFYPAQNGKNGFKIP